MLSSSSLTVATQVLALGPAWLDPAYLLNQLGATALWGAAAIIFAECGLFTFFMPGDSLLFTIGLFVGSGNIPQSLMLVCLVLGLAAFAGNVVGYEIGRAVGPALFTRPDSRFLKPKYLEQTNEFFERHGARAIVLARFVPIVRTFITLTAGAGRMPRRTYLLFSAIGAVLWAVGLTLLGHQMGSIQWVQDNLELMAIGIVAVSFIPVVLEYLRNRKTAGANQH